VPQGGALAAATTDKAVLRDALMSDLRGSNLSATCLSEEKKNPALMGRFCVRNGHNDTELVAKARAAVAAIEEREDTRPPPLHDFFTVSDTIFHK
jgi:hypothetical protein